MRKKCARNAQKIRLISLIINQNGKNKKKLTENAQKAAKKRSPLVSSSEADGEKHPERTSERGNRQ